MPKNMFYRSESFVITNATTQDFELHFTSLGHDVCYQRIVVGQIGHAPTLISVLVKHGAGVIPVQTLIPSLADQYVAITESFYVDGSDRIVVRVKGGTLTDMVEVGYFGYYLD